MKALVLLCALCGTATAETDRLSNRETAIAGFGLVWMQVDGASMTGMAIQPTLQRTFDRFETQLEYTIADLRDDKMRVPGANLHRLGIAARYQAGRVRVDRHMTLDFVVETGIGLQYLDRDTGDAFGRNDFALGIGLRSLSDVRANGPRVFLGFEAMMRVLVTPSGDKAFVGVFGVPLGR